MQSSEVPEAAGGLTAVSSKALRLAVVNAVDMGVTDLEPISVKS
jgi:hypothetical protein